MLRRFYDWILGHADKPYAVWILAAMSFAESSFFPLPPDVLLIPMSLAERRKALFYATVATVSSVLGGYLGYAIGYFVYDTIGRFLVEHLWSIDKFEALRETFDTWGFWLIIGKGATPIPYKIVTILCGVLHYDLAKFTAASIIARGMRFYLVAILLYFYGEAVRDFIERRLALVTTGFVALLVGAFLALRFL